MRQESISKAFSWESTWKTVSQGGFWQFTLGFDLEAMGIINAESVPEPISIIGILISGLLGLSQGGKERK